VTEKTPKYFFNNLNIFQKKYMLTKFLFLFYDDTLIFFMVSHFFTFFKISRLFSIFQKWTKINVQK